MDDGDCVSWVLFRSWCDNLEGKGERREKYLKQIKTDMSKRNLLYDIHMQKEIRYKVFICISLIRLFFYEALILIVLKEHVHA